MLQDEATKPIRQRAADVRRPLPGLSGAEQNPKMKIEPTLGDATAKLFPPVPSVQHSLLTDCSALPAFIAVLFFLGLSVLALGAHFAGIGPLPIWIRARSIAILVHCLVFPQKEAEMRVIVATFLGLTAFGASSLEAAPNSKIGSSLAR